MLYNVTAEIPQYSVHSFITVLNTGAYYIYNYNYNENLYSAALQRGA